MTRPSDVSLLGSSQLLVHSQNRNLCIHEGTSGDLRHRNCVFCSLFIPISSTNLPFEELHRPFRIDVPFTTLFDTLSSTDICLLVKKNIASLPNPFDASLNEKRLPFIKH